MVGLDENRVLDYIQIEEKDDELRDQLNLQM
jgi:hypothetical protein